MFSQFFTPSFFPTGWRGGEAAPPEVMFFVAYGSGHLSATLRATGTGSAALGGGGQLIAATIGRGHMSASLVGGGSLSATIQGDAGGPTFRDMSCSLSGSGQLRAEFKREFRGEIVVEVPPPHRYADIQARMGGSARLEASGVLAGHLAATAEGSGALRAGLRGNYVPSSDEIAFVALYLQEAA